MNFTKIVFTSLFSFSMFASVQAQGDLEAPLKKPSNWKLKSVFSLNITQSSFTNWASGGRNNVSGLAFINANADYSKDRIKWANQLSTGIGGVQDRKSTRLNSSHVRISYAVFCLKKK